MDNIAEAFRHDELLRRAVRRRALRDNLANVLARMKNEGLLLNEELTPDEQEIHARAVLQIQQQGTEFQKMLEPNYWRRLWRALLNR